MYAIKHATDQHKVTPNQLPCQIRHNGPVPVDKRYWSPESSSTGGQIVYFRGRKLEGKVMTLPGGYEGAILQKTGDLLKVEPVAGEEDESEVPVEVKLFSKEATFDEVVVWGHEALPEADDAYVKSIEEWMKFAEAVSADCCRYMGADLLQIHAPEGIRDAS